MRALLFSNLFPTSRDPNRGLFTRQIAAELARLCDLEVAVPLPWFPSGRLAARLAPGYSREFGALADEISVIKPSQAITLTAFGLIFQFLIVNGLDTFEELFILGDLIPVSSQ